MQYDFHPTPYTQDRIIDGLSITAAGRIGLPKYFLTIHHIEPGVGANLYWDAKQQLLAIEFTTASEPTAFPVKFTKRYGGYINGTRFFKYHQINPEDYSGRHAYTVSMRLAVGTATLTNVFLMDLKERPTLDRVWRAVKRRGTEK